MVRFSVIRTILAIPPDPPRSRAQIRVTCRWAPRATAAVKRIILVEQTPAYTVRANTGVASVAGGPVG
jgi:hypothetical protein